VVVARKQDYYINEQLAYSLHVVCDFRAKMVGVVKKKIPSVMVQTVCMV